MPLLPFWCSDAKGGELVLLGIGNLLGDAKGLVLLFGLFGLGIVLSLVIKNSIRIRVRCYLLLYLWVSHPVCNKTSY
jgi:hypothetical protein